MVKTSSFGIIGLVQIAPWYYPRRQGVLELEEVLPKKLVAGSFSLFAVFMLAGATERKSKPKYWVPPQVTTSVTASSSIPEPIMLTLDEVIEKAALKHHVDSAFIKSVMAAESGFKVHALSPKGAMGIMQVMPETAKELGYDAAIPEQNIQAGTRYISWLMARYKDRDDRLEWVIAAYNAGPGNVEKYGGIPPFVETQTYVTRVMGYYERYRVSEPTVPGMIASTRAIELGFAD